MMLVTLIAALMVAQPTTAAAGPPPTATAILVTAREGSHTLDGRVWRCDPAGVCTGRGVGASQPLARECRRFVARLGPVSAYARGELALTSAEVAACNGAAR